MWHSEAVQMTVPGIGYTCVIGSITKFSSIVGNMSNCVNVFPFPVMTNAVPITIGTDLAAL